ncbi:MAG: hypothetical protein ACJ8CR_17555 [Roseiflexaceae bacterium]
MVDILLAHSYFLRYDAKQQQKMRPYPPLATLYAASLLRSRGFTVALFDAMLADGEHEFADALQRHQPRFVVLYEDNFNFLSKMCLSRMRDAACSMSELARASGAAVIAAGSDVTDRPELYFAHGVQYALLGEPDHTLVELLDAVDERRKTKDDRVLAADTHHPSSIVRFVRSLVWLSPTPTRRAASTGRPSARPSGTRTSFPSPPGISSR